MAPTAKYERNEDDQDAGNLEVEWHDAGAGLTDADRRGLLESLPRLSRAARNFPATKVHVEVEWNPRKGGYGVSVHLALASHSLFAAEWARDLDAAGRSAFQKVCTQATTCRAMLRRHERRSRRRELHPAASVAARAPAPRSLDEEREALAAHRGRLARLVRHEIVHDTTLADIPKESISVPDVVDEAMVWTMENLGRRPPFLTPEQFLFRRVLHQLDLARASVLRRAAAEKEEDRVEAGHREPNPEVDFEWEDAEDLLFGGGEPLPLDLDEAAVADSDPGAILDREALQRAVSDALRELPEAQRRSVLLHDLEGYDPAEIAFILARSEDRVRADLDGARVALRRRLRDFA